MYGFTHKFFALKSSGAHLTPLASPFLLPSLPPSVPPSLSVSRFVEAAVYTDHTPDSTRKLRRKAKSAARKGHSAFSRASIKAGLSGMFSDDDDDSSSNSSSNDSGDRKGKSGDHEKHHTLFSSFRWGAQGKFGDSPRREYKTDEVARLKDLVGGKRKVGGEVRLKVECLRPPDSVVTTVSEFLWCPQGFGERGAGRAGHMGGG